MNLNIAIPPDAEAKLRERAAAEGKDPAAFALEAVQEKLATPGPPGQAASSRAAAWDRFVAGMNDWAETLPPNHRVDDEREQIYEGCGQ